MSIKKVLNNADKSNITKDIDKDTLALLGQWVKQGHEDDKETMSDWLDIIKEGTKLAKVDLKAQDKPWDKASNYKSPIIGESVRDFGDRATTEILRQKDLVAGEVIGEKTPEKLATIDRVTTHMNYQINHEITNWRKELEKSLYRLSAQGTLIKKSFYNAAKGYIDSEVIGYPDFSLNNKCSNFDDLPRFTHVRLFYENDIHSKLATKEWADFDLQKDRDNDDKSDNFFTFLECYCSYDLDGDGYAEPYIVTVHEQSGDVVRVAPRYSQYDVWIQHKDKTARAVDVVAEIETQVNDNELMDDTEKETFIKKDTGYAYRNAKLVRIDAEKMLTLYDFITPTDGTLLGHGFLHIMSSSVKGINKSTNALFNAGDLANSQGGWLSKEHRSKKKGKMATSPGRWHVTNIDSMNLVNSVMPFPLKEPSPTLLALNGELKAETQMQGTKTNIGDMMQANMPAVSVLGALQEGIIPTTALITRVVGSMSEEFKVIAGLNAIYTDPQQYVALVGEADYKADYNDETYDLSPTANAQFSSQFQRVQLAQVQMETIPMVLQMGGNPIPIGKAFYDAIGSDIADQVFPEDGKIPSADQENIDKMNAMQQEQIELGKQQTEIMQKNYALAERKQDLDDREAQEKAKQAQAEQARKDAETQAKIDDMEKAYQLKYDELAVKVSDIEAKHNTEINKLMVTDNRNAVKG